MGERDRSTTEWAVLGIVAEGRTHGFAVARALAPGAPVGTIWSVSRPLVYRALVALERDGAIAESGTEPGPAGPPRTMVTATRAGKALLRRWLAEPVDHVRDARSELLLKLLFLDRSGADPARLARAQSERFAEQLLGLEHQLAAASGFEATALRWRVASTQAALDFLAHLLRDAR